MPMFVDHSPPGECIFCKLVKGDIPSAKIYEDDLTIAFMDIGQATRGHVLVASKRHAVNLLELTPEEAGAVMQTAQRVAAAVNKAFDPGRHQYLVPRRWQGRQCFTFICMCCRASRAMACPWSGSARNRALPCWASWPRKSKPNSPESNHY